MDAIEIEIDSDKVKIVCIVHIRFGHMLAVECDVFFARSSNLVLYF